MIMAVAWAKEYELADGDMVCNKNGGNEEQWGKPVWDFEFHLRKTTMTRRPDLPSGTKQRNKYGFVTWHALNNRTLRLESEPNTDS